MIVTLNGYHLNDGTTGAWLDTEVKGLELPTIRTSAGNYAGRDGGYLGSQFFSARDITLQGTVFSSNVAILEQTRQNLQAALVSQSVTMGITTNAGNSYTINCYLLDFQMPIKKNVFSAPFKIELLATDPTIYENNSYSLPADLAPVSNSGFVLPVTFPIDFPAASTPTTVTNNGNVAVYPIITLSGVMHNPVITNTTLEQLMGVSLTTAQTDQLVINFAQRTILLNGSSVFGDMTAGSTWWQLQPGENAITLTTSSGGDTVTGTIQWQSGYMGI